MSSNQLSIISESRPSRTANEQELFMLLSPIYLEKITAAEHRGSSRMVIILLTQKLGSLPSNLLTQVEALSMEQLQSPTQSVFNLSSIEELSRWLDTEKISDS